MPAAGVQAVFPGVSPRAGLYESFYLRAVHPEQPLGVWIRYTAHKPPGGRRTAGGMASDGRASDPQGSVWCTVFDGEHRRPFMHKLTTAALSAPAGEWIAVGDSQLGPGCAEGVCGEARWSLRFASREPELRHLPRAFLYRTPLPRTKLTSPVPAARFEGTLVLGTRTIQLDGWRGMVGHNWGAEHAERWIWLHGIGFREDPDAWLDVAIGRVRVAGRTTPWVANGALRIDGERLPLGGLGARGLLVAESPRRCTLSLPGPGGVVVEAHVHAPPEALAGWRYVDPGDTGHSGTGQHSSPPNRPGHRAGDPDGTSHHTLDPDGPGHRGVDPHGPGHDVSNCSIAALTLSVRRPGRPARTLRTAHGAAYELGMRERDHGVPIAPFPDG